MAAETSAAQTRDMQASIAAAQQSAEAAMVAAAHIPKTERAYLFLELNIRSNIDGLYNISIGQQSPRKAFIEFHFQNHGRTPAVVESLQVAAKYWTAATVPTMRNAPTIFIQPGLIAGDKPIGPYRCEFDVTESEYKNVASNEEYQFLFWGKIVYRDVFGEIHETGWCRANFCNGKGWQFSGDHSLNYYT